MANFVGSIYKEAIFVETGGLFPLHFVGHKYSPKFYNFPDTQSVIQSSATTAHENESLIHFSTFQLCS